ncbi:760_t:CDS:2 [Entrophospora sp. SA101]|nr:760_t:CDS:2 [Entrophospora sp. SA101]
MSEKKILYRKGETKDFDTYHEKIRVKIEVLNEDVARVFLVDKNDIPIDDLENVVFMNVATKNEITTVLVENRKSYLITWINSYELSVDAVTMSENKILYVEGETKDLDTGHENIRVKIEVLNEDVARVFLVDKNDIPIDDLENVVFMNVATKNEITTVLVENRKSYLITWINSYELSVDGRRIFKLKQQKEQSIEIIPLSLAGFIKKK